MRDLYYTLGVSTNCTSEEIKEAYRKLAKKFHPDMNPDDEYFESRFREIKEAYNILSDPESRRRYNRDLNTSRINPSPYNESAETIRRRADELKKQEAEIRFEQAYQRRQIKFKNRRKGTGITIVLILLTLIFGVYIFKSFNDAKKKLNGRLVTVENPVAYHAHKKHKKKYNEVNKIAGDSVKRKSELSKAEPAKPAWPAPAVITRGADSVTSNNTANPYAYVTYVHPNITGVVLMRESGNFNSSIIKTIPGNAQVLVLERGNAYYKINFNNVIGFVPKWSLAAK